MYISLIYSSVALTFGLTAYLRTTAFPTLINYDATFLHEKVRRRRHSHPLHGSSAAMGLTLLSTVPPVLSNR